MSDENKSERDSGLDAVSQAMDVSGIYETMDSFMGTAGVDKVYGRPIRRDQVTMIPTAEIVTAMGFGTGGGAGGDSSGDGGGAGGGGGGRTFSRPVAIVIASPEGVRVEPVIDVTKIALAALTAFGFMLTTRVKMVRGQVADG